jgi:hypothetical protein
MPLLRGLTLFIGALLLSAAANIPQTKLTVEVSAAETGRMLDGASVIVRFRADPKQAKAFKMSNLRTSWETKTNEHGSVSIPQIPMGTIEVQVIAQHYQTFGDVFQLNQPEQTIAVKLNPPQAQYSEDAKSGKK